MASAYRNFSHNKKLFKSKKFQTIKNQEKQ